MPIYEYRAIEASCAKCAQRFEAFEKMSDPHLEKCPECGAPVRRVISAPANVVKDSMGNSNLKRLGFTKYQKNKDGFYEKKFGGGPDPKMPV